MVLDRIENLIYKYKMAKCATKWQSALQNGKVRCKMAKCARSEFTLSEIKNEHFSAAFDII